MYIKQENKKPCGKTRNMTNRIYKTIAPKKKENFNLSLNSCSIETHDVTTDNPQVSSIGMPGKRSNNDHPCIASSCPFGLYKILLGGDTRSRKV